MQQIPTYTEHINRYSSTQGEEIKDIKHEWEVKLVLYSLPILRGIGYNPKTAQNIYYSIFSKTLVALQKHIERH